MAFLPLRFHMYMHAFTCIVCARARVRVLRVERLGFGALYVQGDRQRCDLRSLGS